MWIEQLHAWIGQGLPCALATVTETHGSVPRRAGAKLVLNQEGAQSGSVGGGTIEHRCLEEARKVLASGEPSTLRFVLDGADWRETLAADVQYEDRLTVFLEAILPPLEVVAFGGGHISERLARLCEVVGLPFRVFDERPEFARQERFPGAREVICAPYEELARHLRLTTGSYCVVLTHGHAQDECVLEQLLRMPFLPYVGMVGSSRKIRGISGRIVSKGVPLASSLYTPAGLSLGGSLPGDIALSILAEIKLLANNGQPAHLRIPPENLI